MAARKRGYSKHDTRELVIYWVAVIAAFFWVTQSEAAVWTTYAAPLGFSMETPDAPGPRSEREAAVPIPSGAAVSF